MCTTHLVQKMLIRETNIKIVSEFMKFVNLLKNMGGKKFHLGMLTQFRGTASHLWKATHTSDEFSL